MRGYNTCMWMVSIYEVDKHQERVDDELQKWRVIHLVELDRHFRNSPSIEVLDLDKLEAKV